jgi:DNA (cytosine-5)-methyltransferase 1
VTDSRRAGQVIPIIDLFAGPGGLGEGFSAFVPTNGRSGFKIALSIEKDATAHQTLELRAFFRLAKRAEIRRAYYRFIRGELTRTELFSAFPKEASSAQSEAWCQELAEASHSRVTRRVARALRGSETSILIGGPPCQAYSLVGRSRNAGNPQYRERDDKRHTLYQEYLRVLSKQLPCVFVMENVKGLLSATYNDQRTLYRILNDLQDPLRALGRKRGTKKEERYTILALGRCDEQYDAFDAAPNGPSQYVVKCEEHGIPQSRHRVILVGVREDFLRAERLFLPTCLAPTTGDFLGGMPALRSGITGVDDSSEAWLRTISSALNDSWYNSLETSDTAVAEKIDWAVNRAIKLKRERGAEFFPAEISRDEGDSPYYDPMVGGLANHSARSHMPEDLKRYLFASAFAAVHHKSPTLVEFPKSLLPDHRNVGSALSGGLFADRFRVQPRDRPSTTITSHIAKDGHYYIHYDPSQCRSLTVREAARLQTFPDNYFFCGPRTAQYHQVGNAVPPLLARQLARAISDYLG